MNHKTMEGMDEEILLKDLKQKAIWMMDEGKYFHDTAHILGVYGNVEQLLRYEEGNRLVLLTSALFHDIQRDLPNHGTEGAKYVKRLLESISGFPKELIDPVSKVINAHDKTQVSQDEKLFYDANKMDAFNELGIARTLMIFSKEGLSLENAAYNLLDVTNHFYDSLHTPTAKRLALPNYEKSKDFALSMIKGYNTPFKMTAKR